MRAIELVRGPRLLGALLVASALAACSDLRRGPAASSGDAAVGIEPTGDAGADSGATDGGRADAPGDAQPQPDAPPACVVQSDGGLGGAQLVFNEVQASSPDFVELFNAGTATANLSGLVIADESAGCPKLDESLTFPAGTTLDPGKHLLIRAGMTGTTNPGPHTACLGDAGTCFHMGLGIGASGDSLYLLTSATSNVALAHVTIPPNATNGSRTYGRLPDGTGPFGAASPTPGAPNAP